jgi:DMSO/TMAO reductase YedYZ molybdopterin-dependent catalytic subunit
VLTWVITELLLLPAAGSGILGLRSMASTEQSAVIGTAAVVAGCLYVLVRPQNPKTVTEQTQDLGQGLANSSAIDRRKLLGDVIALGAAGLSAVLVVRAIAGIGERGSPASAERSPVKDTSKEPESTTDADGFTAPAGVSPEITPTERFYVVSKNLVDPTLSANGWTLEIRGLTDRPRRFSYSDILAMPSTDVYATLECVSNSTGGDLISNTRWTGVRLTDVLKQSGLHPDGKWIVFRASDGYEESLPFEVAQLPTTLLAYNMNGATLPSKHGYPLRVLAPGNYGMKNPKWLTTIQGSAQPSNGYWEHQGWNVESGIKTTARFDTRPRQATAGNAVQLGGIAFGGNRGVSQVELSTDGGSTWKPVSMSRPLSKATWVLWTGSWVPERSGKATLAIRATDGEGQVQIPDLHEPYPTGATGYDIIQVQVSG